MKKIKSIYWTSKLNKTIVAKLIIIMNDTNKTGLQQYCYEINSRGLSLRCGFVKIQKKNTAKSLKYSLCSNIKNFIFFYAFTISQAQLKDRLHDIIISFFFFYRNWYRAYKFLVFGYDNSYFVTTLILPEKTDCDFIKVQDSAQYMLSLGN